jgi:hypothetical protein
MNTTEKKDTKNIKKKTIKTPKVLKPHGTATWLIINYPQLTVEQIANFCEMEHLQVLFLKNEIEEGKSYATNNPVSMGYITEENLLEASQNPKKKLVFVGENTLAILQKKRTKRVYVSFLEKKNRLAGALWIVNFYKNLHISAEDIRTLTNASIININKLMVDKKFINGILPVDPIKLNLCTRDALEEIINKYSKKNQ